MADKRLDLLKTANKLFRQGKIDAAVKEYKKIIALKPDDLEVRRIIGDLQLRLNNNTDAIEQFEWIADYYMKEGFFAKAIAMYKRITRVDPNYEEALFKLADLYTKQGLVIEAKQIYLDIAEECKRRNNQKKALGMYKKILEFDRHNIKMRILLAENYLKEGMIQEASEEYMTAIDILINKRDYERAEELLLKVIEQVRESRFIEKLLACYTAQDQDDKAIRFLSGMGAAVNSNPNLLKVLGELYLKKDMMNEAEKVFIRIAQLAPEETEVIIRLGKVYMQREEYDRTFQLFLPIIEKNIQFKKFEEAASLLRLIIASRNTYIPALTKLAAIYKISGKTNNLIALFESLIPIYERKGMREELKKILEELVKLSDTPFTYQEQLDKLAGQVVREREEEEEGERESEFVAYNLRQASDALRQNDMSAAIEILMKAKSHFPQNLEIREKMLDVHLRSHNENAAVEEGKDLLDLYKDMRMMDKYSELHDRLSQLKPEDEKLVEISHEERTNIELDFPHEELNVELQEMEPVHEEDVPELLEAPVDDEFLLLPDENLPPMETERREMSDIRSLSHQLSELDFYISERYFSEAEKLIGDLKSVFPGNQELVARFQKLEKARAFSDDDGDLPAPSPREDTHTDFLLPDLDEEERTGAKSRPGSDDSDFIIESGSSHDIHLIDYNSPQEAIQVEMPEEHEPLMLEDFDPLPSPEFDRLPSHKAHAFDSQPFDSQPFDSQPFDSQPFEPQLQDDFFIPDFEQEEPPVRFPEPEPAGKSARFQKTDPRMGSGSQQAPVIPPKTGTQPTATFQSKTGAQQATVIPPKTGTQSAVTSQSKTGAQQAAVIPPKTGTQPAATFQSKTGSQPIPTLQPKTGTQRIPAAPVQFTPPAMDLREKTGSRDKFKSDINLGEPEPLILEPGGSSGSGYHFDDSREPLELGFPDEEFIPELEKDEDFLPLGFDVNEGFDEAPELEIQDSIVNESHSAQEYSDSKFGLKVGDLSPKNQPVRMEEIKTGYADDMDLEIEFEEASGNDAAPALEIDRDLLIQAPSAPSQPKDKTGSFPAVSGSEDLDFDSIIMEDSGSGFPDSDSPFKEISGQDILFESEEDLLTDEPLFLEELYYEIEKNVLPEIQANMFWLKEVEKQRTSTIEKNMMEIFDEFKRGVDEKIGKEDFDTRYNLGIAYKEMGLLEEAIHEFLISSKAPLKFFDSAGLLGMCFREKGMFAEAINWFEKALQTPERKTDEYMAIKFELVLTYKLMEEYMPALRIAESIMRVDPSYRSISDVYREIRKHFGK